MIKTPLVVVFVLALVALFGSSLGGAEPARAAFCGNTYGGDVISTTNLRCGRARKVVKTWGRRYKRDGRARRNVLGFRCAPRNDSVEGLTMRCRRGKSRIRWYVNVP